MSEISCPSIVKDPRPLSEAFLPEEFVGRQVQLGQLQDGLLDRKPLPRFFWLHGPPGAGKSSLVRRFLGELENDHVRTAYVNCWSTQTFFGILEAVFQELRALVGDQRDVAFKFERLQRLARDTPVVLVLDEIDQVYLKERNACLYNFARLDTARVVCLGQTRASHEALDPRVRSRVRPVFIEFRRYTTAELVELLEARAMESLAPESWCRADLDAIAAASQGDARVAIQGLRTAAYLAEKKRTTEIRAADIEAGLRASGRLRRRYLLASLSDHHRLLYRLVEEAESVLLRDLWLRYLRAARELDLEPMARRTFNHYRQFLVQQGLLRERQGAGRANQRILEVVE